MKDFPRLPERPEWMNSTPCAQADVDLWYPKHRDVAAANTARGICMSCRHRAPCLTYALETNEKEGIWGGKTPEQRRLLRRQQRLAAA